jgi:hypothetical protein
VGVEVGEDGFKCDGFVFNEFAEEEEEPGIDEVIEFPEEFISVASEEILDFTNEDNLLRELWWAVPEEVVAE